MFDNKDYDLEKENISSENSAGEAPSSKASDWEAETSETETSKAETSETETSKAETSETETSEAETSKAETSEAETSKAETSEAETSKAETSEAETSEAPTENPDFTPRPIYRYYPMYPYDNQPNTVEGEGKEIPPTGKGKGVFWVIASVMFVVSILIMGYFVELLGIRGGNVNGGDNSDLPSHEYTSTVEEHIGTEAPLRDIYTDKTQLYNDAQKSCVTVICSKKSGYFGQITESVSLGSGFTISKDGYIVTNAHVVEGGSSYKVRFYSGNEFDALLVGKDSTCDIAVLKIHGSDDIVPVSFGDSNKVRVGEFAMAIGTPSDVELFGTMTFGVVSGRERKVSVSNSEGQTVKTMLLLQTDATLNPGNSGGPLFNMYGQVIGINTMKLSDKYEGMGFAIPSSGAVKIINSLISLGEADYTDSEYVKGGAQIGIRGITLNAEAKKEYKFPSDTPSGALILSIEKKSSAYKAGLSVYDVICEFNGIEITSIEQLIDEIQECYSGEEVTVLVYRIERNGKNGEYHTYTFALDAVEE